MSETNNIQKKKKRKYNQLDMYQLGESFQLGKRKKIEKNDLFHIESGDIFHILIPRDIASDPMNKTLLPIAFSSDEIDFFKSFNKKTVECNKFFGNFIYKYRNRFRI